MNCQQTGTHTIKPGDSFYLIARRYQMTVPQLMEMNPGMDPYNLQVGTQVMVCMDQTMMPEPGMDSTMDLYQSMRLVWLQHIYWTKMLLDSIGFGTANQDAVTARLMQNPHDIANVFAKYYPANMTTSLTQLLTEHLNLAAMMMKSWKDGNMSRANDLYRQLFANADQIAAELVKMNPDYSIDELRGMLYRHLEMLAQMTAEQLAGNYMAAIREFGQAEKEILALADYLSAGIQRQFPQKFR